MPGNALVEAQGDGCRISVAVTAGASRTEIVGIDEWRHSFHIRVAAERTRGEANNELIRFLADRLSVRRTDVRLVRGASTSHKTIYVPLPANDTLRLLGGN